MESATRRGSDVIVPGLGGGGCDYCNDSANLAHPLSRKEGKEKIGDWGKGGGVTSVLDKDLLWVFSDIIKLTYDMGYISSDHLKGNLLLTHNLIPGEEKRKMCNVTNGEMHSGSNRISA